MESSNVNSDELKEINDPPVDESTGVKMWGFYANGPDYYVASLRQQRAGEWANQTVEPTEPKPQPEGPVCPSCGNAITAEMKFCPECGTELPHEKLPQ